MKKRYCCAMAMGAMCAFVGLALAVRYAFIRKTAKEMDDWADDCPDLVDY